MRSFALFFLLALALPAAAATAAVPPPEPCMGAHCQACRTSSGTTALNFLHGLHRYNNQDHAMLTGMYAARNAIHGETNDLWSVNADLEYHETVTAEPGRNKRLVEATLRLGLAEVMKKLDRIALGVGTGQHDRQQDNDKDQYS